MKNKIKKEIRSIEITTKIGCINNCKYCPQEKLINEYSKRSKIYEMSFNNFKKYISTIPKDVVIVFAGFCEPWLNKDCLKMVLYVFNEGYKIEMFTTLVGMSLSDFKKIEHINFNRFVVHLPNDSDNIKVNQDYLKLLKYILTQKGCFEFNYVGNKLHNKLSFVPNTKDIQIIDRAKNLDIFFECNVKYNQKIIRVKCTEGLKKNNLLPNGDVILCCMDYGLKHILGNLSTQKYKSLFRGKEFKKIKEGKKATGILCKDCYLSRDYILRKVRATHYVLGMIGKGIKKINKRLYEKLR